MRVRLWKRLGNNAAGSVVVYPESTALWLIQRDCGEPADVEPEAYVAAAVEDTPAPEPAGDQFTTDTKKEPEPAALEDMSLKQLQARATELGLPTYGTKAQLTERIRQYGHVHSR